MIDQRAKPRIIVTIEEGLVSGVYVDGLPDMIGLDLITIDYDTDGHDEDEDGPLADVGGVPCHFSVAQVEEVDGELGRDVGRAYLAWSMT